ncbi:undecaprenyl diphosphate synthase family protein, partial [Acinetobacter baumannii]
MLKKIIKEALYRLYEVRLARQIAREPVPRHVGLILDGNRRYGKQAGIVEAEQIYRLGAEKLDDVLDWCVALEIPAITLWVLSTENFTR